MKTEIRTDIEQAAEALRNRKPEMPSVSEIEQLIGRDNLDKVFEKAPKDPAIVKMYVECCQEIAAPRS